jgi:hypothetical protein
MPAGTRLDRAGSIAPLYKTLLNFANEMVAIASLGKKPI